VIGGLVVALVVNIVAIFRTPAPSHAEARDTEEAHA